MVNNMRSMIGGLAMLAGVAFGGNTNDVANVVKTTSEIPPQAEFTDIGFLTTNNMNVVELKGNIYSGDTNHYKVQSMSNLLVGAWQDSDINTNIYSRTGRAREFIAAEPLVSSNMFYRLKSIGSDPQ